MGTQIFANRNYGQIKIITLPLRFETDNQEVIELSEGDYIDNGKLINSSLWASFMHFINYKN